VTVAAYAACTTCKPAGDEFDACNAERADRQDHPVNCVSWVDADTYCRSPEVGKRLPTEPEWEFAAGGPASLTYPWGGDPPSARYLNMRARDSYAETAPVGTYPAGASPFGALDMAGNVTEWVADEYAPYGAAALVNPAPVKTDQHDKVYALRGGAWLNSSATFVRAAFRGNRRPTRFDVDAGFRCARDLPRDGQAPTGSAAGEDRADGPRRSRPEHEDGP
jgi:formylglycine-generating enzyme required for sulfatase activity